MLIRRKSNHSATIGSIFGGYEIHICVSLVILIGITIQAFSKITRDSNKLASRGAQTIQG